MSSANRQRFAERRYLRSLSFAWPAAASAAPSSWRTPIHSILLWRTASAIGLSESPMRPNMCLTPIFSSTSTKVAATVSDICTSCDYNFPDGLCRDASHPAAVFRIQFTLPVRLDPQTQRPTATGRGENLSEKLSRDEGVL